MHSILTRTLLLLSLPLSAATPPNIVMIYADDLGYGDISCNGAKAVTTPNIDRLASEGINFRDGYATSSTCTPSRFSTLTGRYAFRQDGTGILPGDAALIIDPKTPTLPSVLRSAGYRTGVVGKWHLGLGGKDGADWNGLIKPGPNEIGFDESFIMAATGDRVPCVYVKNGRVVNLDPNDPITVSYKHGFADLPTGIKDRSTLLMDWTSGHNNAVINGIGRIGFMKGGTRAVWKDENMADDFSREANAFIRGSQGKPFFLYYALHDIHVPRVPNPRFVGKTTMGPRGDAIVQADWQVGEIMKTLDELKLTANTLVLFSSDNGPVVNDGYRDGSVVKLGDHKPAGPYRDGKYSVYEGGTRVPFIVRWPAKAEAGKTSTAVVCQVDLARTFAKLADQPVPAGAFPDSLDLSAALTGKSDDGRDHLVGQGERLTLRVGNWKLIPAGAKGRDELYDLSADPAEKNNLAAANPGKVKELAARLDAIRK